MGVAPDMARDMLGLFTKTAREQGGIVQFKVMGKIYFLITNPQYVKYILQDNHHNYIRGASVERGRMLLGNGLPLIDGDFWLRERRLMQPAFHPQRLESLVEIMVWFFLLRNFEGRQHTIFNPFQEKLPRGWG